MLYYSGYTRRIGDVDEGSTVTDFLPAERARGITIQSAAISFSWPPSAPDPWIPRIDPNPGHPAAASSTPHTINLIDTPGHADFTFEVLRSLRVLDGAVCILDGVAGVEAQTEKVWSQASAYRIPRLIFVNKLDRDGAAFGRTVSEVGARLGVWPAVCGIPWWTPEGKLRGVGDVVGLRGLLYGEGGDGKDVKNFSLKDLESEDAALAEELKKARVALVELLAEHDDAMVEDYLAADEDQLVIHPASIIQCLRRCILRDPQKLVPVYPGASFRNVGVQPLLDAVVDLLPSPDQHADPEVSIGSGIKGGLTQFLSGKLTAATTSDHSKPSSKAISTKGKPNHALQNLEACALAFKVVADPKRGVLVYVRVYSGILTRNAPLWNTNLQTTERAQRLLKMYANDAVEVENIAAGQIGVIPGLKFARTGDTLVSYTGAHPKNGPPAPINSLQLRPIDIPPPVFFVSVEPNSLAEEKHISESLDLLLREDPSLHVTLDEESGQTHLSGMGELHLEIARDRLVGDLRAKARIGGIEIGYREAITGPSGEVEGGYEREVAGKWAKGGCGVSVESVVEEGDMLALREHEQLFELTDKNHLVVATPTLRADGSGVEEETPNLSDHLPISAVMQAFKNGASAACARGPTHAYPVHSTLIRLTFDPAKHVFPNTTLAALSSVARSAVQQALQASAKASETVLMEPVMLVTISVDEDSLGGVVHDISSARGGSIVSLGSDDTTLPSDGGANVDVRRIYAPPDPFAGGHAAAEDFGVGGAVGGVKQIVARVPLKEMVGYLKHLRSLTGGRGTFTMVVDRFERMGGQRMRGVLGGMRSENVQIVRLNPASVTRTNNGTTGRQLEDFTMSTTLPTSAELDQMAIIDPEIKEQQQQIPQSWQLPEDKDPATLVKLMRAGWDKMPTPTPIAEVEEFRSSYITRDGTTLRLCVFKPAAGHESKPLPLLVWYHGGGGCLGNPESTTAFCRSIVLEQSCVVVAPQYRLAPEYKSPAQVEDSWDALQHIASHVADFGADASAGFIAGGESAGAVIGAVLALQARDKPLSPPLTGTFLTAGSYFDPNGIPAEYKEHYRSRHDPVCVNAPMLGKNVKAAFDACLQGDYSSPLFKAALWPSGQAGLPRTYLQTCGLDINRDEGILYADVLREAGVQTKLDVYPGGPHCFWHLFPNTTQGRKWKEETRAGIAWLLEAAR
ncbi:hypothetical protein B0A55_11866 [Friedmanniomyces simplex]|uniref:Ribosome-releasing factor 2, mitochondrial n=1 Tax=Friedmanniomyces simplex TaxID=329884 RepID=A0A4U0WCK4_9PEZI|nr:hypothetical protein B0A55_11866 [Friedmanniomyces simplex]